MLGDLLDLPKWIGAAALVLVVTITIHEFGHFILAKRSGIRVDEFAVGFGPRVIARRRGETLYSVRAIPAGGFVRMAGMTGLAGEADAGDRNFYRASIPRRSATILAGGVFNLLLAALVFSIREMPAQASVVPGGTPFSAAGLRSGDVVLSVSVPRGRTFTIDHSDQSSVERDIHASTEASQGNSVTVTYRSTDGHVRSTTVRPYLLIVNEQPDNGLPAQFAVDAVDGRPVGAGDPAALFRDGASVTVTGHLLGDPAQHVQGTVSGVTTAHGDGDVGRVEAAWRFGFSPGHDGNSPLYALARGFTDVPSEIATSFTTLYQIATTPNSGGVQANLSGPVGIARETATVADQGWTELLWWVGILSLNLGVFNLLPIPFLDGGRFAFILVEAVRRRRVDPRLEALVHSAGLALILMLVVYVTIGDLKGHS